MDKLTLRSARGRWVLTAAVLGSGMAFLDSTVVNVALPAIGQDLGADVAGLQWVLTGYLVTLAALILVGGSLGDRYGRRRVFVLGVGWFAVASAVCAAAPSVPVLVAARMLQGAGGALLTPGSLALIEASFVTADRAAAIGAWSGLAGVTTAIGPALGGWLVDLGSWRWIFLLNLPLAAVTAAIAVRHVPESKAAEGVRFDLAGAATAAGGLAATTWTLIAAGERGFTGPVLIGAVLAVTALGAFVLIEHRSTHPMLPLQLFGASGRAPATAAPQPDPDSRKRPRPSPNQFTAANLVTAAVYAALGSTLFLLVVHLQQVLGYSALQAGLAALPLTLLMLALSGPSGALAQRIGPRLQLSAGPLLAAVGLALLVRVGPGDSYVAAVLPGMTGLGLGMATTVAPLTATVLAAVDERHAGLASGVNNATARIAQLAAIAVVPAVAGLTGAAYEQPEVFAAGFRTAMRITSGLAALGGVLGFALIRNPLAERAEVAGDGTAPAPAEAPARRPAPPVRVHCGVDGPALDRCPRPAGERAAGPERPAA